MINAENFLASLHNFPDNSPTEIDSLHPALRRAAELGLLIAPTDCHSRFASAVKTRIGFPTCELAQIFLLASKFPRFNWLVETGRKAGLAILEADVSRCQASLSALSAEDEEGDWRNTLQFSSGVAYSLLFRIASGRRVRFLGQRYPGLKVYWGAPAFLPPSWFVTGPPVKFVQIDAPILSAPEWLLDPEYGPRNSSRSPIPSCSPSLTALGESIFAHSI